MTLLEQHSKHIQFFCLLHKQQAKTFSFGIFCNTHESFMVFVCGQLMYQFARGSFSDIELPLTYSAHSRNDVVRDQPVERDVIIFLYTYIIYDILVRWIPCW